MVNVWQLMDNPTMGEANLRLAMLCLNGGRLRQSKPEVKRGDVEAGIAAYAWRMAAFQVSINPKHHCMPCTADFDLPGWDYEYDDPQPVKDAARARRKAAQERGDRIAKAIVDAVNPAEWHGIRRWGQAFGMIGSPRVTEEGAIIYR